MVASRREEKPEGREREVGGRFWLGEMGLGVFILLEFSHLMAQVPRLTFILSLA